MKRVILVLVVAAISFSGCKNDMKEVKNPVENVDSNSEDFNWNPENFADIKIIRYKIPGFDKLTLKQKKYVYYLTEAGYAGRDISWDQNYKYNLEIRKALETIVNKYSGDKSSDEWKVFMVYVKRVWFSSGIHHHYSNDKFTPGFSKEFFKGLLELTGANLSAVAMNAMFDPSIDAKKVNLNTEKGLVKGSAVNFYDGDITEKEVDDFYGKMTSPDSEREISYGLNSKVVRGKDGKLEEKVWFLDGMYGESIAQIVFWLEKAKTVAENECQAKGLGLLIDYYKTGDLKIWDDYNIVWASCTEGDIDYINGFVEVYNDPKGYKGSYESIVEVKDFEASERMAIVAESAQWFEDNSTIMDEHKKEKVVGVTYKVVNVAGEAGDASPSTPIGVNLPNANWIRAEYGSKSVSLGNLIEAYSKASGKGFLEEFCMTKEEVEREKKYGGIGDKMHTALHEVIGHASGKLNKGIGTPKETLKNYASTLEEARADLVGLYFLLDPHLIEMGLIKTLDVGKTAYDGYIRNGLMTQLRRIELGNDIEEAHMRNRQLVCKWAFEKGEKDNVIERVKKDGKSYFIINDYDKLRGLFGELLKEIQRIKSEGDYESGKKLVEDYGVKIDIKLHEEVLARAKKLNIPAYGGFINPVLIPITNDNGEVIDIKVEYPDNFTNQMLNYGKKYSFLLN